MADINRHSLERAEAAAAKLWAFGSASFPIRDGAAIQRHVEEEITDTAIAFSIHVRRLLDNQNVTARFKLDGPFHIWESTDDCKKVDDLRDALNRIVHAVSFEVGFEKIPTNRTKIAGGAIVALYLRTRTDQREEALIDVFSLASCFFHNVLPVLENPASPPSVKLVQ